MQVVVDRIEEDYIVLELEDGSVVDVPKVLIPGAKEGDVIDIYINRDEKKKKNTEVKKLMDDLFID